MLKQAFLFLCLAGVISGVTLAHSPWGHYQVYRQQHLLILSVKDDAGSYPYSKRLAKAINEAAPEASARPARAMDLERAYNLLRTNQFQFALLSKNSAAMMRRSTGQFSGKAGVDLRVIYQFGELEFVVRADFPGHLVSIVTHAVLKSIESLPDSVSVDTVKASKYLHPGARKAMR